MQEATNGEAGVEIELKTYLRLTQVGQKTYLR